MPYYTAKTRAKARGLYETGHSMRQIESKMGVTLRTIKNWATKEEWVKNSLSPKVQQKEQEGILAVAYEVGLTKKRVLEKITEFQDATRVIWVKDNPEDVEDDGGKYTMEVPDYMIQLRGNQQAIDVLRMAGNADDGKNQATPILIKTDSGNITLGIKNG